MIIFLILLAMMLGFGCGFALGMQYWSNYTSQVKVEVYKKCIHGFEDWDECPDCGH
jgi:hypothetical protein